MLSEDVGVSPGDHAVSSGFSYGPARDDDEFARILSLARQTYLMSDDLAQRYAKNIGRENFRAVRAKGVAAGSLALIFMGQHFGGRRVPMAGVGAVCVAPEHRAGGAASFLMRSALQELHVKGVALSTLYPATWKLYRSVGYQQAGSRHQIRVPLREINIDDRGMTVRQLDETDDHAIAALQRHQASQCNGNLDRNEGMWRRARFPRDGEAVGYGVFDDDNRPQAYLYYTRKEGGPTSYYNLQLSDLCVASGPIGRAAGRRLWSLLAHHRSLSGEVVWFGSPDDPFLKLLPERVATVDLHFQWMLRVIDVPAALMARGWPLGLNAELHLDIEDDLITANNGRYVLELADGKASVSAGGRGDVLLDVRGLAGLYSGHQTPIDLYTLGLLRPAGHVADADEALARLHAAFASPAPWMSEMF